MGGDLVRMVVSAIMPMLLLPKGLMRSFGRSTQSA